jgi:hypothetical protein
MVGFNGETRVGAGLALNAEKLAGDWRCGAAADFDSGAAKRAEKFGLRGFFAQGQA